MSGPIRQRLGPMSGFLRTSLDKLPDFESVYDSTQTYAVNQLRLQQQKAAINERIENLTTKVTNLLTYDQLWCDLIQGLHGKEREAEEEEKLRFTSRPDNYLSVIERAESAISTLKNKVSTIEQQLTLLHPVVDQRSRSVPPTSGRPLLPPLASPSPPPAETPKNQKPKNKLPGSQVPPQQFQGGRALHPPAPGGHPAPSQPYQGGPQQFVSPHVQTYPPYGYTVQHAPPFQQMNQSLAYPQYQPQPAIYGLKPPKITIPTFAGDPLKYVEWWDTFESQVHATPMPDINKFHHLKATLRGDAAAAILGIKITNLNYPSAIALIQNRFGKQSALKIALYNELDALSLSSTRIRDIRTFVDKLEATVRQLENIGETIDTYQTTQRIVAKIPSSMHLELKRSKTNPDDWTMTTLRSALWNYITIREEVAVSSLPPHESQSYHRHDQRPHPAPHMTPHPNSNFHKRGSRPHQRPPDSVTSTQTFVVTTSPRGRGGGRGRPAARGRNVGGSSRQLPNTTCAFCQGPHWHDECDRITTLTARREYLRQNKCCFACLQPGHPFLSCSHASRFCVHCQQVAKHHRALCPSKFSNNRSSTTLLVSNVSDAPIVAMAPAAVLNASVRTVVPPPCAQHCASLTDEDCPAPALPADKLQLPPKKKTHLLTALLPIIHPTSAKQQDATMWLDSCSERTFITTSLAKALELPVLLTERLSVESFAGDKPHVFESDVVMFDIRLHAGELFRIHANTVPRITKAMGHNSSFSAEDLEELDMIPLEDMANRDFKSNTGAPDILLAEDYLWDLIPSSDVGRTTLPSGLHVIPSKIGFFVGGSAKTETIANSIQVQNVSIESHVSQALPQTTKYATIDQTVADNPKTDDWWALERVGITEKCHELHDEQVLRKFIDTILIENSRYFVQWPYKTNPPDLPTNEDIVFAHFLGLSKRLLKDSKLRSRYTEIIMDQLQKGVIEEVPNPHTPVAFYVHYLSHHPVLTEHKLTTKCRIVFNGSLKASKDCNSFNDCLHKGPNLLAELVGLLLRFRLDKYAMLGDVEKAFLQVGLQLSERDVTRFFYFRDPEHPDPFDYIVYRFCRVLFGAKPSPFMLNGSIRHLLETDGSLWALECLLNLYVDNLSLGAETPELCKAKKLFLVSLFASAGFRVYQWTSNSKEFRDWLSAGDGVAALIFSVLGLKWNVETDRLAIPEISAELAVDHPTKRQVSKFISSAYDPLGLACPVILNGKHLFQQLWTKGIDWDTKIPSEMLSEWRMIVIDLQQLHNMKFPRYYAPVRQSINELHGFVDASKKAFGVVIYMRTITQTGIFSTIIYAKSRLTPTKATLSIPRSELTALRLGVRAVEYVKTELHIPISKTSLWTDSECVLYWLNSSKEKTVFVENRLKEIRQAKDVYFGYVSTVENPADLASRGTSTAELQESELWTHGPKYLRLDDKDWTTPKIPIMNSETLEVVNKELRKNGTEPETPESMYVMVTALEPEINPIDISRFSSLNRLLRTTVMLFRFCARKINHVAAITHPLWKNWLSTLQLDEAISAAELDLAEQHWIRTVQRQKYSDIINALQKKSKKNTMINQLGLYFDDNGVICSRGRMTNADLPMNAKFPYLLPPNTDFTRLVIRHKHFELKHSGAQHTLAGIRQKYWLPQGLSQVKAVIRKCSVCKLWTGGPYAKPSMPPLPAERVKAARPFQYVGIDFFGHMWVKNSVGERSKVWAILFTCLVTRGIHLELVSSMSSPDFLDGLERFMARRGKPEKIFSDNAPTFKLTDKVQQCAFGLLYRDEDVVNFVANERIKWVFIPEFAPWMGGAWERLIGIVKNNLKKSIGRTLLTYEAFGTLLVKIEAIVNSRPLTHMSSDREPLLPLRPCDFWQYGARIDPAMFAEDNTDDPEWFPRLDTRTKLIKHWNKAQQVLIRFWDSFKDEYLLQQRATKNVHNQPRIVAYAPPKVNDVCLISDREMPRGMWKMARVNKLIPSADGQARVAEVQLPSRNFTRRAISLLHPFEVNNDEEVAVLLSVFSAVNPIKDVSAHPSSSEKPASASFMAEEQSSELKEKPKQSSATKSTVLQPPLNLTGLLMLFLVCIPLINCQKCSTADPANKLTRVESHRCVSNGTVIYRQPNDNLCWLPKSCPTGHLDGTGQCQAKCACPTWADHCSPHQGPEPISTGDRQSILTGIKPSVCSYEPDRNCDPNPVHGRFFQIMLYDRSIHYVTHMHVQESEPTAEQYDCIGNGPQTGTPAFCASHNCQKQGTRFCYYKRNSITYLVTEDGNLPIRAWGSVAVKYYGVQNQPEETECKDCELKCIQGGVEITVDDHVSLLQVCSAPYCYKISLPKPTNIMMFPPEVSLSTHEIIVIAWSNGVQVRQFGISCPSHPFCELITCYFCRARLFNPQCAPKASYFLLFLLIYFASMTTYVFFKLTGILWLILKRVVKCFMTVFRMCFYLYRVTHRKAVSLTSPYYVPVAALLHRNTTPDTMAPDSPTSSSSWTDSNRRKVGSTYKEQRMLKLQLVISIPLLLFFVNSVTACADVTTLTAQRSSCSLHKHGELECVLTQVTRLALVPQGQDTCLLVKDPNGEPIGTLALAVEQITLKCVKTSDYFTRSYKMDSQASKRCSGSGSCSNGIADCYAITKDSKVEELKAANSRPGFTYCHESCGCAGCNCFYCTPGCLFYRTFAVPTNDKVYELFSCPTWAYELEATARLTTQGTTQQHKFILSPGIGKTWNNMKVTLISVTAPPVPILGSTFLTDGKRTTLVKASASGQPVSGTVGSLQCANRPRAQAFDCYWPKDSCACTPQNEKVSCTCSDLDLEPLFLDNESLLPLEMQGLTIFGSGSQLRAEFNRIASLELQVSLEGFRLSSKIEKNKCQIKALEFGGCYSCRRGARLRFKCTTDFGEALAHVSCGTGSFSTICTPQGLTAIASMSFSNAAIEERCKVECPGGQSEFRIKSTLVYIDKEQIGEISNIIAGDHIASEVDFGFLAGFLSENWIAAIIVAIVSVIILIITVPLLPVIANMLYDFIKRIIPERASCRRQNKEDSNPTSSKED